MARRCRSKRPKWRCCRVIHAADLPDPSAVLEKLASGEAVAARPAEAPKAESQGALLQAPASFPALIELLSRNGKVHLAQQLHDFVGLVLYAPPELVVRPSKPLAGDFVRNLADALHGLTGTRWQVRASDGEAEPSLLDQENEGAERLRREVLEAPLIKAAFEVVSRRRTGGLQGR